MEKKWLSHLARKDDREVVKGKIFCHRPLRQGVRRCSENKEPFGKTLLVRRREPSGGSSRVAISACGNIWGINRASSSI